MRILILTFLLCIGSTQFSAADPNKLYVIQMGDFHSHFQSHPTWGGDPDPSLRRGGAAHVKTAIKEFINKNNLTDQDVLIVDSGDWSEGSIFYKDGLGKASLQMLDLLGVEVSVLGNHDFYNGPTVLENAINSSQKSFPILAANLKYPRPNLPDPNKNLAKRLSDKVQVNFKNFKPKFASSYEMAFFTRLFLAYSDVPNEIDQEKFDEKLSGFLTSLRDRAWYTRVNRESKIKRLFNITNVDSILYLSEEEIKDGMTLEKKDSETRSKLWEFWIAAKSNTEVVKDGDVNRYVLERPLISDSFLIPKGNTNVCLFGIVTHELPYQHFFDPVTIDVPYPTSEAQPQLSIAERVVKNLKDSKACNYIIALTHQTDQNDRILAETVGGIDMILGGHSHNHINPPIKIANKKSKKEVPIFKAGKFGEMLSTFSIKSSKEAEMQFGDFKNIEIIPSIFSPDKDIEEFVLKSMERINEIDGKNPFTNKVVDSEISLERFSSAESTFGNYLTSAIRYALESGDEPVLGVDLVIISPFFMSSDLPMGEIYDADLFNLLSLVYNEESGMSWRVATIDMSGKSLRIILDALFERGMIAATDEMASIIFDPSTSHPFLEVRFFDQSINEFKPLSDEKIYRLALPEGIVSAFHVIEEVLDDVSFENEVVYDIEVWEALSKYLTFHKKLTLDKAQISQRLSSISPDLSLSRKDLKISLPTITVNILNNGQSESRVGEVSLFLDSGTPDTLFDNGATIGEPFKSANSTPSQFEEYEFNLKLYKHWDSLSTLSQISKKSIPPIQPGKSINIEFDVKRSMISKLESRPYPILVTVSLLEGEESITENNRVEGVLLVP